MVLVRRMVSEMVVKASFKLEVFRNGDKLAGMEVAEIIREAQKLPEKELQILARAVEEASAAAVDARFEEDILAGKFDAMAAEALKDHAEGKTIELDAFLADPGLS